MRLAVLFLVACLEPGSDADPVDEDARDFVVSPGFEPEQRSGTSEGVEQNDSCEGWYAAEPNHLLTFEQNMLAVTVEVDRPEARLWIRWNDNDWCSDDEDPLPYVSRGAWTAGTYEVFVGVQEQGGTLDYTVTLYEGTFEE